MKAGRLRRVERVTIAARGLAQNRLATNGCAGGE